MTIEEMVVLAIGWLSVVVILFMLLILFISKIEVKNSKKALNLKLAMHYNHRFHRMRVAFEKNNIFIDNPKTPEGAGQLFRKHSRLIQDSIPVLSNEIMQCCVQNQFIFIENKDLKSSLILNSKDIVDRYQRLVHAFKAFEEFVFQETKEEHLVLEYWESLSIQYDTIIHKIIDAHQCISTDGYLDIIKLN